MGIGLIFEYEFEQDKGENMEIPNYRTKPSKFSIIDAVEFHLYQKIYVEWRFSLKVGKVMENPQTDTYMLSRHIVLLFFFKNYH